MLEEKMDPTVKTKVEADPMQAVQGDPWKKTTVGHGNKQESISGQFGRKLEELNMPKKEELKNELRRQLEELNMPKDEDLKKEQAQTKTTAGSIKDEFMRKLSMLEQESGPMTQGQATMDDDLKGLSESVEGSLPHADEVASTETPPTNIVRKEMPRGGANREGDVTSSEESEGNYCGEAVPRSWIQTSGRWRRARTSISLPMDGADSPDAFFNFEELTASESMKHCRDQGAARFELTPDGYGRSETADEAVQATISMREEGTQTMDLEAWEDTDHILDDPDVFVEDGDYCKNLSPAEVAEEKASAVMGGRDENGFTKVAQGCTSDSGAADTVGPEDLATDYPLEESYGSKHNIHYVGAGGHKMNNLGQRRILVLTKEKHLRWMTIQVAKVKKLLGSVSWNNDCDQDVVYSKAEGASYIKDNKSGEKIQLERNRGTFKFDMWVIPYKMVKTGVVTFRDAKGAKKTVKVNNSLGFSRQG